MSISAFDSSRSMINAIFRSRGLATSTTSRNAPQQSFAQIVQQLARNLDANSHPQTSSPVSVTGLNSGQLAQVAVSSPGPNGQLSLQGSVIQTANFATLTVVGSANGTVNAGSYLLSGSTGSTTLEFSQGQSVSDVATQVNQTTKTTGVTATVSGHNLVLSSTQAGSRSIVNLQPLPGGTQSISGVNAAQIGSFQVIDQTAGTTGNVAGNVVASASQANLVYHGAVDGTVAGSTTFRLTGANGSTNFAITKGESLSAVADRINQQVTSTGVVASVQGNDLKLTSNITGVAATVQVDNVHTLQQVSTTGFSNTQVTAVNINSIAADSTHVLTGQVLQTATQAQVTLQGTNADTVADTATFQLTGALGSTNVSIQQGQALSDVAAQINTQTNSTGVVASVANHQVVFKSAAVGSESNVAVQLTDITHTTVVSGVNAQQLGSFQTNSLTTGASDTLSGQVTQTATQAQVTLQGTNADTIIDTATFQLTGALGSTNISITQGQALSNVAAQINTRTNLTGVVANVANHQLVFQSSDVGSGANVAVQLTDITHTNVVSGVNAQQLGSFQTNSLGTGASDTLSGQVTQTATQATATLQGTNADTVVDTATFQLTGARGSTSISITQGQALSSVAAQINAQTNSTGVLASVANHQLVLKSSDVGSAAGVAVNLTNISHTNVVTGVNSQQLASFQTNSLTAGASDTLSGTVTQAATQANVNLQGSNSDTVIDTATFQLTGTLGSTSISMTQGQALSSVAAQINAQTVATGVVASVSNHQLVFKSSDVGSAADVAVNLTNITHTNVVTGVNAQQLTSFQVNSFTSGASETLSGNVTQTAGSAQLSFTGSLGLVNKNASFTLQGVQGSVQISTSRLETLAALASQINSSTVTTGVTASLSGDTLTFKSTGVGSNALVKVTSISGNLHLSGGDGNGTATGTNAVATINGHTITGTGNSFQLSDALGNYSFTAAAGFTGAISPVSINSVAGQFALSGGNGNGTANGTNAIAIINGQTLTGTGSTFHYADAVGSYSFTTASGYTGTISPVSITSQAGQFALVTGNGNGTSNGTDAVAVINGHTRTGTGNSFQYSDAVGSYSFTTASGYTGTISPVNITSQAGQFLLAGGNGDGTANGTNAVAIIHGQTLTGTGNSFQYADGVGSYSFTTASGFTGTIDPVNITSQAGQFALAGGNGNGTANGTDAVAIINGQTVTGSGDTLHYVENGGDFQIQLAPGYQGALAPIVIQSHSDGFQLQGGDSNGAAHGTNLVAVINGGQQTSSSNTLTVHGQDGTYQVSFVNGFVGQFDPVTVKKQAALNTSGGDQNGFAYGSDAVAVIDGQIQTGDGSTFTYANRGAKVTLQFLSGFHGQFDSVRIGDSSESGNSSTVPAGSTQPPDNTSNSLSLLNLLQQGVNQKLLQSQFDQLDNVLQQIQIAEQVMSMSSWAQQTSTANQTDPTTSKDSSQKNSSQETTAPVQAVNSSQSSASRLSILA